MTRQGKPRWVRQDNAAGSPVLVVPFPLFKGSSNSSLLNSLSYCSRFCLLRFQLSSLALALSDSPGLLSSHTGLLWALPNHTTLCPLLRYLPLIFPRAYKDSSPIPAACKKPHHLSRCSSNVTFFTKLSFILHQSPEHSVSISLMVLVQQIDSACLHITCRSLCQLLWGLWRWMRPPLGSSSWHNLDRDF